MKRNKLSQYATAVAIASLAGVMSACGSSSGSSAPGIAGIGGVGGTASNTGGCVPLTTTMSFSATNAYIDSANIYAVPSGTTGGIGTTGTMTTYVSAGGAVATTLGNGVYSNTWNSAVSDAYVSMTVNNYNTGYSTTVPSGYGYTIPTPTIGTGYPYGAVGSSAYESLTGSLQFTSLRWETLIYEFQSEYGYGGVGTTGTIPTVGATTIPNVCISGVALSVGHYNNLLYGGNILLFLNNNPSSYIDIVL